MNMQMFTILGNAAVRQSLPCHQYTVSYRVIISVKTIDRNPARREDAMIKLYIAVDEMLVVVSQQKDAWRVDPHLVGSQPQCLAVDPLHPEQVYCGTFDQGLWRSRNAGVSWEHVSKGIDYEKVLSVAVSALEQTDGYGVVYTGTEPSALFRS